MILVIFINYWPAQGESVIEFMYVKRMFQWKMDKFSYYATIYNAISNVGMMTSMPIFHYFNTNDNVIILIAGGFGILMRVFKGLVKTEDGFFASTVFALLSNMFYAPARAQISRCVLAQELGKVSLSSKRPIIYICTLLGICNNVKLAVSCSHCCHTSLHQSLQSHS